MSIFQASRIPQIRKGVNGKKLFAKDKRLRATQGKDKMILKGPKELERRTLCPEL